MDKIIINDLEVFYHVGVPDSERAQPQRLLLTIEMTHDFSAAARRDDLNKTIDYAAVSERLRAFGDRRSWKLIESLSVEMADMILKEFQPQAVSVEVKKFIIPQAKWVAVKVVREGEK